MKYLCTLLLGALALPCMAQYANFDSYNTFVDSIYGPVDSFDWQIGKPEKTLFTEATGSRALITDTVRPYPASDSSFYQVPLETQSFWYPYFIVAWTQRVDAEAGIDGGYPEVSYDIGQTWHNVFTDTVYRPLLMSHLEPDSIGIDTLFNGEVGFTGTTDDWQYIVFCWENGVGNPPFPMNDTMLFRFVFVSDSNDTGQDGWMIDDLRAEVTVIDAIREVPASDLNVSWQDRQLNITFTCRKAEPLMWTLYDLSGRQHWQRETPLMGTGEQHLRLLAPEVPPGLYVLCMDGRVQHGRQLVRVP